MQLRLDMLTLCRTCLQDGESHMVSIFEATDGKLGGGISLGDKIEILSGIQIKPSEDLPSMICLKCKAFLTLAHKFRQICQRSNQFLREYVIKDAGEQVVKDVVKQVNNSSDPTPAPNVESEQYEQLEVEVVEEEAWATEDLIEEALPSAEKEQPTDIDVPTVPARNPAPSVAANGKLHVCEICGNGYPRKSTLDTHMRRHNNERPFECEICHKSFHVNYQLKRHIRKHTGSKPYTCQYCQRSFADRTSLVKHESLTKINYTEEPTEMNVLMLARLAGKLLLTPVSLRCIIKRTRAKNLTHVDSVKRALLVFTI
ncbi:zinc finger protein 436 isoform X2 [Drosophila ficusphila]|uniref:zinc finger protein 436 isoform X2 n=1 Tax=Drosophila ficusphila TaxID=30025 RepID=UPI001C8A9FFF|nr:zinc finger protein 436 isoform X2 [Drosophila ficusphila]